MCSIVLEWQPRNDATFIAVKSKKKNEGMISAGVGGEEGVEEHLTTRLENLNVRLEEGDMHLTGSGKVDPIAESGRFLRIEFLKPPFLPQNRFKNSRTRRNSQSRPKCRELHFATGSTLGA